MPEQHEQRDGRVVEEGLFNAGFVALCAIAASAEKETWFARR